MDERKSVLSNNQAIENSEQDFQFANGVTENCDNATSKQYNRDILLQLRLHPLSLQKPTELPEMEVIKDKLYLNDITDKVPTSPEKHMDTSTYHPSTKSDYYNMKPEYPVLSPYFNRVYPYCYSSHSYNGPYQPYKCRSSFNTYCNPLKKHSLPSHQCLKKDFPLEEFPWAKHFLSSDDMWNCFSNHLHSGAYKKREHLEAVPKSKKKLPIIDPVTGKNVLETVHPNQSEENDTSSVEENAKSAENHMTAKQFCGDCPEGHETDAYKSNEASYDSVSSDVKTCLEELKDSVTEIQANMNARTVEGNLEEIHNTLSNVEDSKEVDSEDLKNENIQSLDMKNEDVFNYAKTSEVASTPQNSKQGSHMNYNKEMSSHIDVHGTCRSHLMKECHVRACNENISKQNDSMQESLRQLREKLYSLKQEEQKVAILQSFLRYKKYQLEESARNLDEKRIEIANWEYNLHNKAKKLQEKEQWLENKNEMLNNKIQQLAEKEKVLNEEENFSTDTLYLDAFKETEAPEKKFPFDNNDSIWSEISKLKNSKMDENNEYSFVRYDSKPAQVTEVTSSNMEKCKSDVFSLEQLEKNLVFIEKMHSSNEAHDSTVDRIELEPSPNAIPKSEENAHYDPIGYTKGRRYLPEHIKYWLDKRDKNAL